MSRIRLSAGPFVAEVSASFGAVLRFDAVREGAVLPLLRPFAGKEPSDACLCGCFPLVPFGNRIAGNRFDFGGQTHTFRANTSGDPLYLHGDGWLGTWRVVRSASQSVTLDFDWPGSTDTPYVYHARQRFRLSAEGLSVTLSVTNRGRIPLPFGFGLHPYFPRTPDTTLYAPAMAYWEEGPGHLPTQRTSLPAGLDFAAPAPIPTHWVNNGFDGWNGRARIAWPERNAAVRIEADPVFGRYALFTPDGGDFLCVEPMSHAIDAHHQADGGGLYVLTPGESLSGVVRFLPDLG